MGRAMVIALSILLLGGVAFAGEDGDRCGKCAEGTVIVKKVTDADAGRVVVLAGEEKECAGECEDGKCKDGKCEGGECKGDGSCDRDGDCDGEGEKKPVTAKAHVQVRFAGDWESLDAATKKRVLEELRARFQGPELKMALEALVKGHAVEKMIPRHQVELGVVAKKCPECAKADGPCEQCRERMKAAKSHGMLILPGGMAVTPQKCPDCQKADGMCDKCRERMKSGQVERRTLVAPGGNAIRVVPMTPAPRANFDGPGARPDCPCCRGRGGMRGPGPMRGPGAMRGPMQGPGPMRGPMGPQGRPGMGPQGHPGMGPQAGPGMGMEPILDALNALREEIRAMRRDMMGAHAGMMDRPTDRPAAAPAPSPREERLENQVRELREQVERLKAHTQKLLERLERLESEK